MLTTSFATRDIPRGDQFEAWRYWYDSVFETTLEGAAERGFEATNSNWTVGGLTVSEVTSPPVAVARSRSFIRRNPVDHWVVTLSGQSSSEVMARGERFTVQAGVPFLLSLGEEMRIGRDRRDDRMQILLSRESFGSSAHLLDAGVGVSMTGPQGMLLAEFLLMLRKNAPTLTAEDASHLKSAVQAMIEVCLAPTAARLARAEKPIAVTLMERVRKAVTKHLRSQALGTSMLCREAATSRSQLYRLLEGEGGVAHYILRRRLSESFAILCDTAHDLSIGQIAEMLCFADASSFSRAFRREFGVKPKEVRAASLSGLSPAPPAGPDESNVHGFRDCLRSF